MSAISCSTYGGILFVLLVSAPCLSQRNPETERIWTDSMLHVMASNQGLDPRTKSDLADSVFRVSSRLNHVCAQVYSRIYQASCLDFIGMADSALTQLYWARKTFHQGCDSMMLMKLYMNLTSTLLTLGEVERVDSVSRSALALWNPDWPDKEIRFMILNNQAIAQIYQGHNVPGAQTFRQIYDEASLVRDVENIKPALINLGTIKAMSEELDSAFYYFSLAEDLISAETDLPRYLDLQYNMANVDFDRGRYSAAATRLDSLFALAERNENIDIMASATDTRSKLYASTHNYKKAYDYLRDYVALKEKLLNEERVKAVTEMMEKYESEKKGREIQELKVANLDANLQNQKITNTRNKYLYAGSGIMLLAIGLFTRLRHVRKSRAAIQHEKNISEGLLLNILPASVADELKIKGHAQARLFPHSTILFSDFKGFTEIAGDMSPTDLVDELNTCFMTFDEIMARHGLEKIKTIGDAYMAAASIPETNTATAGDVIRAAMEMQRFIIDRKKERDQQGLPSFEMRTGIHSGPVVAGIVGVRKFQYDLWGDTVNIASRMETHGMPGRINISEATYQLVKDEPSFSFAPRGMIHVKGKGDLAMYFVDPVMPPEV